MALSKEEIIEAQEVIKAFTDFLDKFKEESDRAVVIVGVAKLDSLLYQILKKALLPSPTSSDELFEGDNAPLFNFSSKIKLCSRLGVINKEFAECLHLIRKIRNNCAHQIDGCDLNSGSEKDRVTTLVNRLKDYELFKGSKEILFPGKTGLLINFRVALALMIFCLETRILLGVKTIENESSSLSMKAISQLLQFKNGEFTIVTE